MRHRLAHRKLNRKTSSRNSLLRGLATQLIDHGCLETTLEKAKELRGVVEPLITLAKVDSVYNRRKVCAYLYGKSTLGRLFTEIAPANKSRSGGYTRVLKLGNRPGDNAHRAVIELLSHGKSYLKQTDTKDTNGSSDFAAANTIDSKAFSAGKDELTQPSEPSSVVLPNESKEKI